MSDTQDSDLQIVILAGGKGKRMNSGEIPKVLCKYKGKEMLLHILDEINILSTIMNINDVFIIVNPDNHDIIQKTVQNHYLNISDRIKYVIQYEVNGTGGAIKYALPYLVHNSYSIILNGDMPNIKSELINHFFNDIRYGQNKMVGIISAIYNDPADYGRIIRNNDIFLKIIEKKDCKNQIELDTKEINAGIYCFSNFILQKYLPLINNNNRANEYYLTSVFEIIPNNEIGIYQILPENRFQITGINTRQELIDAENQV